MRLSTVKAAKFVKRWFYIAGFVLLGFWFGWKMVLCVGLIIVSRNARLMPDLHHQTDVNDKVIDTLKAMIDSGESQDEILKHFYDYQKSKDKA